MSKFTFPSFAEIKALALKNFGDTAAVVCSLLVIGYIWSLTSPIFAPLVVLQHNVTNPADNEPFIYTFGPADSLLVLFIITVSIVFYDLGKEVFERIVKYRLSKEDQKKFVFQGNYLIASVAFLVTGYYSLKHEETLTNYSTVWAKYPFHTYQAATKLFFLISIGYWLSLLVIRPLAKLEIAGLDKKVALHIALLLSTYLTGFAPLAVLLSTVYYAAETFAALHTLIALYNKGQAAKKATVTRHKGATIGEIVASLAKILRGVSAIVIVALATHVLLLALNDAPSLDIAALNFNNIIIRAVLLVGVSALVLVPAAAAARA